MSDILTGSRWPENLPDIAATGLCGLAHDLKSWLTPVHTCLQLWESGELDKAAALRHEARQNLDAVMDFLEAIRQRGPMPTFLLQPVKLGPLLQQAIRLHQAAIEQKKLLVNFSPPIQEEIAGDPLLLLRLASNLLANAIQAAPLQSALDISLKPESSPSPCLRLSIQNQSDPAAQRPARGGLGLRICREIMALHNGTLDLQVAPDSESITVVATFPQTPPPTA